MDTLVETGSNLAAAPWTFAAALPRTPAMPAVTMSERSTHQSAAPAEGMAASRARQVAPQVRRRPNAGVMAASCTKQAAASHV